MHVRSEQKPYKQTVAVEHQGRAIAFASTSAGHYDEIYYAVLDDLSQSAGAGAVADADAFIDQNWSAFRRVPSATQMRVPGMGLVTTDVTGTDVDGEPNTTSSLTRQVPFCVLSDGAYLYLFRAGTPCAGSLLVDRFVLQADGDQLVHATEVRYVRSENPYVPQSDTDTLGDASMDGDPFVEPAFLLPLAQVPDAAGFAVVQAPGKPYPVWHVLATVDGALTLFSIPGGAGMPFDLAAVAGFDTGVGSDGMRRYPLLRPAACYDLRLGAAALALSAPAAAVYFQQEPGAFGTGELGMVGEASVLVTANSASGLLTLDLAVGGDGRLAGSARQGWALPDGTASTPMYVASQDAFGTAVELDGRNDALLPPALPAGAATFLGWFRPQAGGGEKQCLLQFGYTTDCAFSVVLDDAQRLAIYSNSNGGVGPFGLAGVYALPPLPLGAWCCIAFTYDGASNILTFYLNGLPAASFVLPGESGGLPSYSLTMGRGDGLDGFRGAIGAFYAWSLVVDAGILCAYSGLQKVGMSPYRPAYAFLMDEGEGTSLRDTQSGTSYANVVCGGRWVRGCAPTYGGILPLTQGDYLTVSGGLVPGVTPVGQACAVACMDGLVRLAYRTPEGRWGSLHYDTRVQRKQLSWAWCGGQEAHPSPKLLFTAVTPGMAPNSLSIDVQHPSADVLSLTIYGASAGYGSLTEYWNNLPTALGPLIDVLNGRSGSYDYTDTANVRRTFGSDDIAEAQLPLRAWRHASLIVSARGVASEDALALQALPDSMGSDTLYVGAGMGASPGWAFESVLPASVGALFDVPPADKFAQIGDLTLEAWVHADGGTACTVVNGGNVDGTLPFALGLGADGRPVAARGDDRAQVTAQSATSIATGCWTHLAAAYRSSSALHLHGQAYVDCGPLRRTPKDALTLEAWVRPDGSIGHSRDLVACWSAQADEARFKLSLAPGSSSDGGLPALKVRDGNGADHVLQGGTPVGIGTWSHLAGTYRAQGVRNMLSFSGADYARVLDGQGVTEALTLEMWVRPLSWSGSNSAVLMSCGMTNNDHSLFKLALQKSGSDLQVVLGGQNDQSIDSHTTGITIPHADDLDDDGADTHLAAVVVRSGASAAHVDIYVNGVCLASQDFSFTFSASSPALGWMLGAEWGGSGSLSDDLADGTSGVHNHYTGGMADARLWSVARTQQQIVDGMNMPVDTGSPGLRGWWKLDTAPSDSFFSGDGAGSFTMQARVTDAASGDSSPVHGGGADYYACPVGGRMDLYLYDAASGSSQHWTKAIDGSVALEESQLPLMIGRQDTPDARLWEGTVDEVRLWATARMSEQIKFYLKKPLDDVATQPALFGYWDFNDGSGTRVADRTGGEGGTIKGVKHIDDAEPPFWVDNPLTSSWTLYADGVALPLADDAPAGSIGDGFWIGGNSASQGFGGALAEVRIWKAARRGAAIRDTMRRPLRGDEDGLVAYWPCSDNPRGAAPQQGAVAVSDRAAAPADATYVHSATSPGQRWPGQSGTPSVAAPVTADADYAVDGGNYAASPAAEAMTLVAAPTMCELQEGGSVRFGLNRSGATGSTVFFDTEVESDATDTVYLGQVQTGARIIGFIEGAPPVPSENLSVEASSNPDKYADCARIAFSYGDTTKAGGVDKTDIGAKFTFDANRGRKIDFSEAATYIIKIDFTHAESTTRAKLDIDAAASLKLSATARMEATVDLDTSLSIAGGFEQNLYNLGGFDDAELGVQPRRLYRPDNVGIAIVRSLTADLYAVRSRRTGATVDYRTVVDPDVPPDTNIITFKINPAYTKNGTLDGQIGFDHDVNYGEPAPGQKGSYYKVQEAYAEKARIERNRAEYGNYFTNIFKAVSANATSREDWIDAVAGSSLVNTYVWTASGGLSSEQSSHGASRRFSMGLDFDGSLTVGASREFESELGATLIAGPVAGMGASLGGTLSGVYTRATGDKVDFGLDAEVKVEGFLNKQAITVANVDVSDCGWGARSLPSSAYPTGDPAGYLSPSDPLTALLVEKHLVTKIGTGRPGEYTTRYRIQSQSGGSWILEDIRGKYAVTVVEETSMSMDGPAETPEFYEYATFVPLVDQGAGQYPINFQEEPCPGKVLAYRFMSFYIAPALGNFELFAKQGNPATQVIDPDWLADPDNPDAVALNDALTRPNPAWRIYHRTTYVNRVPPELEEGEAGDDGEGSEAKAVTAPSQARRPDAASIERNALMIRLLMGSADETVMSSYPGIQSARAEPSGVPDIGLIDDNIALFVDTLGLDKKEARELGNQLHDYMVGYIAPDTAQAGAA